VPAMTALPSYRTPSKLNANKIRGIVNRPIASSIVRAQEEFKLFVSHPDEIDHNLYGRFLGILKGVPPPSTLSGASCVTLCCAQLSRV
jgi:hypothetical protein